MYGIVVSARAKKALKKYRKSGTFPISKFDRAVECLRRGEALPATYKDHALHGNLAVFREFHIASDLLVHYERNDKLRIITIVKVGTHGELFGE